MPFALTIDPTTPVAINPAASERELLVQLLLLLDAGITTILERLTTMSQIATDTAAAVAAENTKIDTLIGLITPSLQALRDANAALQAQVDALKAGDAADAATMQSAIDASNAEAAKVQTVIDTLTPPPIAGAAK